MRRRSFFFPSYFRECVCAHMRPCAWRESKRERANREADAPLSRGPDIGTVRSWLELKWSHPLNQWRDPGVLFPSGLKKRTPLRNVPPELSSVTYWNPLLLNWPVHSQILWGDLESCLLPAPYISYPPLHCCSATQSCTSMGSISRVQN